ncbi:MAG TPA: RsmB/NOP family class I SAM-dependent RNA methyltransferase [Aliiroseovarius sp.]|nr:RsmB/NOP family class I SAM-dependent RNA methyltransferase [Aliiroseovarius sp.]
MTPAARIAAAIEVLDTIASGTPAEKVLTTWARKNRYAGAKDRAALRDLVFEALRNRASFAHLGGGTGGRALMLGLLRSAGTDPAEHFTGQGYAPAPLSSEEGAFQPGPADLATRLDCPSWLLDEMQQSLGNDLEPVLGLLKSRAPVFVRVNSQKATRDSAIEALAADGIMAQPHPLAETALELVENPRRLRNSVAFRNGLVELQDAASQAVSALVGAALEGATNARVLDYCAGGGGKSLALAARDMGEIFAHDADPARMRDLPERARRAGAKVEILAHAEVAKSAPYDLVLADVPCSGSGAWRRAPAGKWDLTAKKLDELCDIQAGILRAISSLTAPNGQVAYVTCSLLQRENEAQVKAFLAEAPGWHLQRQRRFSPLDGGDGFFVALLKGE